MVALYNPTANGETCGWQIEKIHDVAHRGSLPGAAVRLLNTAEKQGAIEISRRIGRKSCPVVAPGLPPSIIETAVEERSLRRILGLPEAAP